jgi:hypothetical protein
MVFSFSLRVLCGLGVCGDITFDALHRGDAEVAQRISNWATTTNCDSFTYPVNPVQFLSSIFHGIRNRRAAIHTQSLSLCKSAIIGMLSRTSE